MRFLKIDNRRVLVNELAIQFPSSLFTYFDLVNHYIKDFPDDLRIFSK